MKPIRFDLITRYFRDLWVALILVFGAVQCWGQQQPGSNPADYVATSLTFPLRNPPQPVPLQFISAQKLDANGFCTYFYWIVANFPIGNAQPAGPIALNNAACTLVSGNQLNWISLPGATKYDVLRTATSTPPLGNCVCAVAVGVTGNQAIDTGVSPYAINTFAPSTVSMVLANEQSATAGQSNLVWRVNGTVLLTMNSATGNMVASTPTTTQSVLTNGSSIAPGTTQAQTPLTITGLLATSACMASPPTPLPPTWQTGIQWYVVVGSNSATLVLINPTSGAITPVGLAMNIKCIL